MIIDNTPPMIINNFRFDKLDVKTPSSPILWRKDTQKAQNLVRQKHLEKFIEKSVITLLQLNPLIHRLC